KKKKRSGTLTLQKGEAKKSIFIRDGTAVFASSSLEEERLGNMLIRKGKITREKSDKAAKLSKRLGKRHGAVLVGLGYLKPNELFDELKLQVREIILSLFLWEDCEYIFRETPPPEEIIALSMSMDALITEGLQMQEAMRRQQDDSFLRKVDGLYGNIKKLSYYDVLEVGMDAAPEEIKKSYLNLAKEFHPDKRQEMPVQGLKEKLTAIFSLINKAYHTLSDETEKKKYDAGILKRTASKTPDRAEINAEEQFVRGFSEFKSGNYWGAMDFLRGATRAAPEHAKYWAFLSLALSRVPKRIKEAEETILKAIELEPHNSKYYVQSGEIYLRTGLKKRAIKQFQTALEWDPVNEKAKKELEKLEGKKKRNKD
ncbi:MAG TPA: DUF4388 domain-containing protein, partial [Nitrospirae bacterium]|nr:DUF4388 domain-containing protein [Nitrospirota bacterium]